MPPAVTAAVIAAVVMGSTTYASVVDGDIRPQLPTSRKAQIDACGPYSGSPRRSMTRHDALAFSSARLWFRLWAHASRPRAARRFEGYSDQKATKINDFRAYRVNHE